MNETRDLLERVGGQFRFPEEAFERMLRRRDRKRRNKRIAAAVVGVATTLAAVLVGSTLLHSNRHPAQPGPISRSSPVLVTPLCEHPTYQRQLAAPFNGPGNCHRTTPAGTYASALLGVHLVWPFTFTLPDGWQVDGIPEGNGLDLRAQGADLGISIIVYPQVPRDGGALETPKDLAWWVSRRPYVAASAVTQVDFAGGKAWQLDVRPRDGAPQVSECRVGARCVPLLRRMWGPAGVDKSGPATVVALLPHTTSRLIFFTGRDGLLSVVWIWDNLDLPGSSTTYAEVYRVVDSLHFEKITCC